MKKIITVLATLIFTVAICIGIYSHQNTKKTSDLVSLNIEALAFMHGGEDEPGKSKCYSQIHKSDHDQCLRCSSCDWADAVGVETGGWCP